MGLSGRLAENAVPGLQLCGVDGLARWLERFLFTRALRSSSCQPPHFVGNFSVTDCFVGTVTVASLVVHSVWLSFLHEVIIFPLLLFSFLFSYCWSGTRWSFCGWPGPVRTGQAQPARNTTDCLSEYLSIYLSVWLAMYPTVSAMFVLPRFVSFAGHFYLLPRTSGHINGAFSTLEFCHLISFLQASRPSKPKAQAYPCLYLPLPAGWFKLAFCYFRDRDRLLVRCRPRQTNN